jgi:MinD superfamily P-loop ATPase
MKQLLVLSGKGGTGKTTIANQLIKLSHTKVFADCDVEAPNLHLMYQNHLKYTIPYYGLKKATIDDQKCLNCGLCKTHCRFNAIDHINGSYVINPYQCEGCGVCGLVCPIQAIHFNESLDGQIEVYQDDYSFSTGKLKMGSGNSGLLVTEVKKQINLDVHGLAIIDGPPGIGCPVIASMTKVDYILMVTEPSMSGFSDLKRLIGTAKKARIPFGVCINKFNLNLEISRKIGQYLEEEKIDHLGCVEYNQSLAQDSYHQSSVHATSDIDDQIFSIYQKVQSILFNA